MGTSRGPMRQLTLFVEASPVRMCPLPDGGRALLESGQDYGSSLSGLLERLARAGLLSKMSPVFYPATEDEILPPSFDGWRNGGMAWRGGFSMPATSEFRSGVGESSLSPVEPTLSSILEPQADSRYALSSKAAAGILRRAGRRGRTLPPMLHEALSELARSVTSPER